ncbi:Huntingtin [Blattella germanica]|nr:Huntingtin [Blattella germanica]
MIKKLVKSFETLKLLQLSPTLTEESSLRRKEKISHCVAIADAMCHSAVKGAPNFSHLLSIAIEILLQLCDDPDVDVRMMADESLNRVIRAMTDTNIVKIQVELHKEIKKNGNPRPLRAALWRFAELCHLIRPQKGKPYATNLIPCLSLLKTFLQNLSSDSAVIRRSASASILTVCLHCRKPQVFTSYVVNTLLDSVIPIQEDQSVPTVLGVLGCLRNVIPHICIGESREEEMKGSFGVRRCQQEASNAVDRLIQANEELSISTEKSDDKYENTEFNAGESDIVDSSPVNIGCGDAGEDGLDSYSDDFAMEQNQLEYSNVNTSEIQELQNNSVTRSTTKLSSDTNVTHQLSPQNIVRDEEGSPICPSPSSSGSQFNTIPFQACDVGSFLDAEVPLYYCCRHLAHCFLLTGYSGFIMPDSNVRVSVKALALSCIASALRFSPDIIFLTLDKNKDPSVKLVEVVSELCYITIHHLKGNSDFQEKVINSVILILLRDEDARVRHAAAKAIVRIVPKLFFILDGSQQDAATVKGACYSENHLLDIVVSRKSASIQHSSITSPAPFSICSAHAESQYKKHTASALSRIVALLSQCVLMSSNKYFTLGCCESLALLSSQYLTTEYPRSWNICLLTKESSKKAAMQRGSSQPSHGISPSEGDKSSAIGLFSVSLSVLMASPISLDLSCQQWLIQLSGNLFSGLAVHYINSTDYFMPPVDGETTKQLWGILKDKELSSCAELLLLHIVRILNIFMHILDEVSPVVPSLKPSLPSLPSAPSLSPMKRKGKGADVANTANVTNLESNRSRGMSPIKTSTDKEERSSDDKKSGKALAMGLFANIPHYMKIHDIVKSAYTNYKITLDSGASEKFVSLLRVTLETLSQLLEISTLHEAGRIAEEVLSYLRCTVTVEPTTTVKCVQQLLKSLFGTNLSAQWEEPDDNHQSRLSSGSEGSGFYSVCFQTPYRQFTDFIASSNKMHNKNEVLMWMGGSRHKSEKKLSSLKGFSRGADKTSLAAYIRLFEPMQYTVTSDVQLQCQVLLLLSQLVQLRVNYCLLDSDQIFIGFILKQHAEQLIPRIFHFLVHLSYEKHHSKCIIGIPKIIQLCDGLMASGQSPITHCIPALVPIVEDVFLARGTSSTSSTDMKELDTQREVLMSMLLRLVEYHQVLELLSVVLNECQDNEERWRRWSLQVIDTLFPLLSQGRVRLESRAAQHSLQQVLNSVSPGVLRPVDSLLRVLFSEAPLQRWLGMVLAILLLIISQGKEEVVLARLEEVALTLPLTRLLHEPVEKCDPLNATTALLNASIWTCQLTYTSFYIQPHDKGGFSEQFSHFLVYCIYMFESGSYCRVASAIIEMIQEDKDEKNESNGTLNSIKDLNKILLDLAPKCPLLMFKWCYFLTLVNFSDQTFWAQVLCTQSHDFIFDQSKIQKDSRSPSACINLEIVRKGGIILFCDYVSENMNDAEQLTWLLVNHIEEIVTLSTEAPVQEFIETVHRNPAASGIVCRVLHCLEGVHLSQSGALLILLISRLLGYPQLAPARLAGTLACRRAELLLTLSLEEVKTQLTEADLIKLRDILLSSSLSQKHNGLMNLLNKLGTQCYNIPPLSQNSGQSFHPTDIHTISVNKTWFLAQITARCAQLGPETAQLLSKLEYEEILPILNSKEFNSMNIMYCLKLGTQQSLQNLTAARLKAKEDGTSASVDQSDASWESPLYRASRLCLLQHIANIRTLLPKQHQVYCPQGREVSAKEAKYTSHLDQLFVDRAFWKALFKLAPAVTCYLQSLFLLNNGIGRPAVPKESWDDIGRFGILCLEYSELCDQNLCFSQAVHWILRHSVVPKPWYLDVSLCCADEILRESNISSVIGQNNHVTWIATGASTMTSLVNFLLEGKPLPSLTETGLYAALSDSERMCAAHTCRQMAVLVMWLQKNGLKTSNIPNFLTKPIKSLIISLSRLPLVNSYVATPPDVWRQGWAAELGGPSFTVVPPLPVDYLQDIDILQQLIFRITLLGWTSRQQFEETWMAFLSVLNSNPFDHCAPEEIAVMVHASNLAVQAITSLLIQTLMIPIPGNPNCSHLVHQPREKALLQTKGSQKLQAIHELFCWRLQGQHIIGQSLELEHVFKRKNIEKILNPHRYGYGQVSLDYLWTATRMLDGNTVPTEDEIRKTTGTPLQLISEAMRSILAISDLFTEKAQFQWMLSTCLEMGKHHPFEDEILHQYLVLGACKAAAVLGPDSEVYERVRKLVENILRSGYMPARIAGLHGVLYLLQVTSPKSSSHHIQSGNTSIAEEIYHIQPLAIEYIQKHIDVSNSLVSGCEEHQLVMWGLVFFLLENMEEKMVDTEVAPTVLQLALTLVMSHNLSPSIRLALLQGLERLVVTGSVGGKVAKQVTKLAVERMRHSSPAVAMPALQLLLSCMYTERSEDQKSGSRKVDGKEHDPELLIQAMERTSALFDRIKKGYPFEVELICGVLPSLLTDFFPPSEIMTKVIGEFLSTQQPHPCLLAAVVFQIFECACQQSQLPLLQDWVVLSVANFTQCSPVGMASWCLTCFFISASTNQWLRAIFPHVQSRIGRCEPEDRKLFCIAAADFYHQLTDVQQKQKFQSAFQTAATQPLFADLLGFNGHEQQ